MKKYRILALLLALVMVFSLTACGKDKKSDDPNHYELGDYVLDYKGACIMYDEYGRDSLVLTFDFTNNSKESNSAGWAITSKCMQNGVQVETAYVLASADTYESITKEYWLEVAPGVTHEVKNAFQLSDMSEATVELSELWSGKSYTITVDPSTLERVENETSGNEPWDLDADPDDSYDDSSDVDTEVETEEEPKVASFTDWWDGDWYGWWIISSSDGDYDGITGYWWDVCAKIEVYDDLTGALVMWDSDDGSIENPCCAAEVSFNEAGTGEHGTMMSESGAFMDQILEHADWIVDPGLEDVDDLIWIDGTYDGDEGSYSYDIYLRPWGVTWDDITEDVVGYEDPIPYTYDWYLSFINAGLPMPDSFDATADGAASASDSDSEDEPEAAATVATGNMIPFSVDGKTSNGTAVPISFSLPEGTWDLETVAFTYKIHIYNCPDADDAPFETPYIWIELKDSEEQLNFYVDQYENLTETDGRTIGGIEMKGRKYDNWGFKQLQEYWCVLPSGAAVSIRLIYMTDDALADAYAILDTFNFG